MGDECAERTDTTVSRQPDLFSFELGQKLITPTLRGMPLDLEPIREPEHRSTEPSRAVRLGTAWMVRVLACALLFFGTAGLDSDCSTDCDSVLRGHPYQRADLAGGCSLLLRLAGAVFSEAAPSPETPPAAGNSAEPTAPPTAPAPPPPPQSQPVTGPVIQEAQPEQIYIRDADGKLKLMLGWTMEQFEELVRIRDGLVQTDAAPRFVVNEVILTGKTEGTVARLAAQISIGVKDSETVRVPLRMGEAVLVKPPEYQGGGEMWLIPDRPGWDYTAFLRGDPNETHVIRLELLVPIKEEGRERMLSLSLPDSAVSRLQLDIPESPLLATNRDGSSVLQVATLPEGGSRLELAGIGPSLKIAWQKDSANQTEGGAVVEVEGQTLVRFGSDKVAFDARLSLKPYGGPLERISIRLPPDCDVVSVNAGDTALRVGSGSESNSTETGKGGKVIELATERPVSGPVEVRLLAQRAGSQGDTPMQLAGFEVLGAVRQTGRMGLVVPNDTLLLWGDVRGVRQIELKLTGAAEEAVYAFEYFGFPFDLSVRCVPRKSHITVAPRYRLEVDASRTNAEINLSYEIRGAECSALAVELNDWVLDEVAPASVIPPEGIVTKDGVTTFSLQQRVLGKLEVTLKLHRDHSAEERPLKLNLPVPHGDVLVPAELVVVPATNIDWRPRIAECVGVTALTTGSSGDRGWNASLFRVNAKPAVLVADWDTHSQEVRAQVSTHVTLGLNRAEIEQRIRFRVDYEPRTQPWRLAVPGAVSVAELTVLLDRRKITLDVTAVASSPEGAVGPEGAVAATAKESTQGGQETIIEIPLPAAVLGESDVNLQYSVPLPDDVAAREGEWNLPLVQPLDATDIRQTLSIQMEEDITLELVSPPWGTSEATSLTRTAEGVALFAAVGRVGSAHIRWSRSPASRRVMIDRAWIQTWLDPIGRLERALFRFHTRLDEVELVLPRGTQWEGVQVILDGKPMQVSAPTPKGLIISLAALPEETRRRPHVLDVWYGLPRVDLGWGRQRVEFPRLGPDAYGSNWYWELILPPTEHFLSVGPPWMAEYQWDWQGLGWKRQPGITEKELQRWIGASGSPRQTATQANRYVFSSLHPVDVTRVWIVRRTWLVVFCSGVVLAMGLLWLYAPSVRRPWLTWLLLTIVFGVFAVRQDWGVLVAQASAFGAALVVTAWILRRSLLSPRWDRREGETSQEGSTSDTVVCQGQARSTETVQAEIQAEPAP